MPKYQVVLQDFTKERYKITQPHPFRSMAEEKRKKFKALFRDLRKSLFLKFFSVLICKIQLLALSSLLNSFFDNNPGA